MYGHVWQSEEPITRHVNVNSVTLNDSLISSNYQNKIKRIIFKGTLSQISLLISIREKMNILIGDLKVTLRQFDLDHWFVQ